MQKKVKKMRKWMASFLIVALIAGNTGLSTVAVGADDIVTDAAVDPGTDAGAITATEDTEPGGVQDLVGSAEDVAEQPANVEQPAEQADSPEVTGDAVANTEEVVEEATTTGTQEESAPAQEAPAASDGQAAANSVSQADEQVSAPAPAASQVESVKSEAPKAEAPKTEAAAAPENEAVKTEEPASQAESAEEAPEQKLNFPAAEQNFTASAAGYDISVKVPANSFEESVTLKASAQTWEQLTGDVRGQLEKEGVDKEHSQSIDLRFENAAGKEIEPANAVDVKFTIHDDKALEGAADKESKLDVYHAEEKEDGSTEVKQVATKDDNSVKVQSEKQAVAEFKTESFSVFTITWEYSVYRETVLDVNCVEETGKELADADAPENITLSSGETQVFNSSNEAIAINGYTFEKAEAIVGNNTYDITAIRATYSSRGWNYSLTPDNLSISNNRQVSLRLTYTEINRDIKITFDKNGGSTDAPLAETGKKGNSIILPVYDGEKSGHMFLGWSDVNNLEGDNSYHPLYEVGSTYTIPDKDTTLYAAWSNEEGISISDFYVRLDGKIPTEPGYYASADYTSGIRIGDNVQRKHWIVDTTTKGYDGPNGLNTVTDNLKSYPAADELSSKINEKSGSLGFTTKVQNGEVVVDSITNKTTNQTKYNVKAEDALYVHWYVQKLQKLGSTTTAELTWHIDGALLVKNKVTITYVKNTEDAVQGMPLGYQTPPSTEVTIGASGSPKGTVAIPKRTGWTFEGWNTESNGTGTKYTSNELYVLKQNTTLYAQWSRNVIDITGTKTWIDGRKTHNNQQEVHLQLTRTSAAITSEQNVAVEAPIRLTWIGNRYTFTNLPAYDDGGNAYTYQVRETNVPEKYNVTYQGYDITNRLVGETKVSGTKTWQNDNKEHDNAREVTLVLERKSAKPDSAWENVSDGKLSWNDNTYTYNELPQYDEEGYEYIYRVKEINVPIGYTSTQNGYDFTNIKSGKTEISGVKTWRDGEKPHNNATEIELSLTRNTDNSTDREPVKAIPKWDGNVYKFEDLEAYDREGRQYRYYVTEKPIRGYSTTYGTDNPFNIINTITDTTEVSGTKTWIDGGKQHNNAEEVSLTLKRHTENRPNKVEEVSDATPSWSGNKYTYSKLPKYDNEGNEYIYTIDEAAVSGYKSTIDHFNLTNTITGTTKVSGTKTWKDGNDQITHDNAKEVTLVLARRSDSESDFDEVEGVTPTWKGDTYTFDNLPQYDPQTGREYEYQVNEINVKPGYASTRQGRDITNTKTGEIEIRGEKIWRDEGVSHNNAKEVKLTLTRKSTAEGSETEKVNVDPEWQENTYVFKKLDAKDKGGYDYEYSVSEEPVKGYVSRKVNNNFINTRTDTMEFSGTKTWLDGGEEHDNAKDVKLILMRSSQTSTVPEVVDVDGEVTLTWNGNTYTYHNLPEYDDQGKRYTYYIDEAKVQGYSTTIKDHDLINTRTGETEVSGKKTWKDGTDEVTHDSESEVTLALSRRSTAPNSGWENLTTEEPIWKNIDKKNAEYTFYNLAQYDDQGYEYEYRVEEINVPEGYSSTRDGNDFTNVKTGKTEISGIKTWQDDGRYHDNATEVQLTLTRKSTANGAEEEKVKATPIWDGNTYKFTNLDTNDGEGHRYTYNVSEAKVDDYKSTQHGNNFTNTITGTTSFSGTKKWVDGGKYHDNSKEVILTLTRTSETHPEPETVKVENPITLTWNGSQYTYSNLPKYDDNGKEYDYHIDELPVEGYKSDVSGHDLINTITGTTDVRGIKTWKDGTQSENHNNEGEVTLVLSRQSAGNKSVWENVENAEPIWNGNTYTFRDLTKYDEDGYEYTYHVSEINIPDGYTSSRDGNDFINTRTGTTEISGVKTWRDGGLPHNNAEEVKLTLTRTSAGSTKPEKVNAEPVWEENTYIFSELPSHDTAGHPYTYSVSEAEVKGYKTTQIENNLFNTITDTTTVSGTKTWLDGGKKHDNEKDVQLILTRTSEKYTEPETVEVEDPITLTWNGERYTYSHLPKYDDEGNLYTYKVDETTVEGYTTAIDGYDLTNTITGVTEISGTKKWIDTDKKKEHDNEKEVTLLLSRESKKKGAVPEIVENVKPTWKKDTYTFSHLPKYDAEGYEYTYGVSEINIEDGYTSSRSGNDFTNKTSDKKEIVGYKEWIDGGKPHDNAKDVRLTLKRKSVLVDQGEVVETLNVKPEWGKDDLHENVYKFSNLDWHDSQGNEYFYWVSEAKVDGYVTEQDGDNFVNVIEDINAKTDFTGTKTWVDGGLSHDNATEVTLELVQQSEKAGSPESVLKEAEPIWNGNSYTYSDLPKYDNEGYEYRYFIREINVPKGYKAQVSVNGRDITNTKEESTIPGGDPDPTPGGGSDPTTSVTPTPGGGSDDPKVEPDNPTSTPDPTDTKNDDPNKDDKDNTPSEPTVTPSDDKPDKEKHTITYNDGVDGEEIFKDQVYEAETGEKTPAFNGTPTRPGYIFKGWTPEVADTVTGDVTYKAVWEKVQDTPSGNGNTTNANGGYSGHSGSTGGRSPVTSYVYNGSSGGSTSSNSFTTRLSDAVKTGDSTEFLLYLAAMLGAAAVLAGLIWSGKKLENQKKKK